MRKSTLGASVLRRKAAHDKMLPDIVTGLQPNLLVRALTTGPIFKKNYYKRNTNHYDFLYKNTLDEWSSR